MERDKQHILYGLPADRYSRKGIWLLAALYFGSLLAAVFLSLAAWKITHSLDPDASGYLANKPYPKFFDRSRWFCVLMILPFLFWQCDLVAFRNLRLSNLSATGFKERLRKVARRILEWLKSTFHAIGFSRPILLTAGLWFGYGIGMICIIYGGGFLFGAIELKPADSRIALAPILGQALGAGILVGLLEEIVFRGLVFRMFYTALRPLSAIILSSAFFVILHFKASAEVFGQTPPQDIGIYEGFYTAWATVAALATEFDATYLASIFLVGILLHQVFLLTSNLWANAALHAGWVFTIKAVGGSFQTSAAANAFTGTIRVADGYWVIVVLAVFIAIFGRKLRSKGIAGNGKEEAV